ncbi:hypothetical protein Q5762_10975 [Streptomyces sp. P9(2023)]|uniref:hypothetical protein n=1 Tax=Streptomyces sp. P9(2023) TaxID=3064394 RepID=UPI0028F45B6C|nr:hypothetical protein [Streptomyces sp. P9(2023)]MDT9688869.1 hypothetical protein [Streptomyces sp. P9(2023)]
MSVAAAFAAAALTLTGCNLAGTAPRQIDFGFRLDASGNLVVAYPLCATSEVDGASIYVEAVGEGEDGNGFTTLWSATTAATEEAKRGLFTVGVQSSFRNELRPLKAPLPDGFYVAVMERVHGKEKNGQDHWVTLARLKNKILAPDEYLTEEGKTLTRDEINAQAYCSK